jgi:hypothetical protein
MSVLSCSRVYCNNIMCDRYSYKYGYLCNECFDELVALGEYVDLNKFMQTEPAQKPEDAYNKWNEEFKTRENRD